MRSSGHTPSHLDRMLKRTVDPSLTSELACTRMIFCTSHDPEKRAVAMTYLRLLFLLLPLCLKAWMWTRRGLNHLNDAVSLMAGPKSGKAVNRFSPSGNGCPQYISIYLNSHRQRTNTIAVSWRGFPFKWPLKALDDLYFLRGC